MSPTELAQRDSAALAAKQITEMFGGDTGIQIPVDAPLPQIKILRETPQYEMPDGTTVKSFIGNILYWHNANQFYNVEFGDGENGPPVCASSNGIVPDGGTNPYTGPCRTCLKNQYGSDIKGGKGKACQNTIRLYVLVDGEILPCVIKASPASLSPKDSLVRWLTNAPNIAAKAGIGTKYQPIVVKFSLHTKTFDQYSTSCIDIETVRVLKPLDDGQGAFYDDDADKLRRLARLYQDFMANYLGRIKHDVGAETTHAQEGQPDQGDGFPDDNLPDF